MHLYTNYYKFLQELQSLVKLSHNHLVPYLNLKTIETENHVEIYVVQQYIKGMYYYDV